MNLEQGILLRASGNINEALELFQNLLIEDQENAEVLYQIAWCMDLLEKEKEAIPFYERAINLGMNEQDLVGAYLGLGSTYRTVGEYDKSLTLFNKALERFPDNNEFRVFRAMTNYNLKNYEEAMKELLMIIAETTSDENISAYNKAIAFY